jgi:hypothetical protein
MDSEPSFEGTLLLGNYYCLVYDEPYARESDPFPTSIERNFDTALLVCCERRIHTVYTPNIRVPSAERGEYELEHQRWRSRTGDCLDANHRVALKGP